METELTLSIGGFPPFSSRGCTQELIPLSTGVFRRTLEQKLVFLGSPDKKYRSIIRCSDKQSLATGGLYPGAVVLVGCIQMLSQKIEGPEVILERPPIPESIFVTHGDLVSVDDRKVVVQGGDFITYRPLLTMQVIRYSLLTEEWGLKGGWELELEEV